MYTKRTGLSKNEGFNLYAPGSQTALYNSPLFEKNTIVTKNVCIPKTDFDTYDIWSSEDWDKASYVQFYGPYGQSFFKGSHVRSDLSLVFYTPIPKNSLWFVLSNRGMHWTDNEWVQGSTEEMAAERVPVFVSGRMFFLRKVISIPTDVMAAYEIRVKYKHGIILYVNGYEILRDNMNNGFIAFDAYNINSYSTYEYRGTVRNGFELGSVSASIAIEIHAGEAITSFDCWMSIYGSSYAKSYEQKMYAFPTNATVGGGTVYTECTDFDSLSSLVVNQIPSGFYFEYDLGFAQSNGFIYYVSSQYGKLTNVEIKGYSPFDGAWVTIADGSYDPAYDVDNSFRGSLYFRNFNKIRYYIKGVSSYPAGFNEFRPILWRVSFERPVTEVNDVILEFTTTDNIQQVIQDSSSFYCSSLEGLPMGISLSTNCVLNGKTKALGSYAIPVMAIDSFGPRYFTLFLSIIKVDEDEVVSYDESYKTTPILITIIFCVCVLIMGCVGILCLCSRYDFSPKKKHPIRKQLPLKKMTDISSSQQIRVIPGVDSSATPVSPPGSPGFTLPAVPTVIPSPPHTQQGPTVPTVPTVPLSSHRSSLPKGVISSSECLAHVSGSAGVGKPQAAHSVRLSQSSGVVNQYHRLSMPVVPSSSVSSAKPSIRYSMPLSQSSLRRTVYVPK